MLISEDKHTLYGFAESVYDLLRDGDIPLNNIDAQYIIQHHPFQEIVTNDDLCLELIQTTLEFRSVVFRENKNRASHILITWLLGIGLSRMTKISNSIQGFEKKYFNVLWLQTAMLHDYGYLRKEIKDEILTLDEITKRYNLLTDTYYEEPFTDLNDMSKDRKYSHFFSYDFEEIKAYFDYSKRRHLEKNDPIEINDHGIVGGCIAFHKYCESIKESKSVEYDYTMMLIQKIACFIAASHNVFKSSDPDTDFIYHGYRLDRLLSNAPVIVTEVNIILLLLSLVDTIECTKRFSKKNNPDAYLIQTTTLKYVEVEVHNSSIMIDFTNLMKFILEKRNQNQNMVQTLYDHTNGLIDLDTWTSFITRIDHDNGYRVEISL